GDKAVAPCTNGTDTLPTNSDESAAGRPDALPVVARRRPPQRGIDVAGAGEIERVARHEQAARTPSCQPSLHDLAMPAGEGGIGAAWVPGEAVVRLPHLGRHESGGADVRADDERALRPGRHPIDGQTTRATEDLARNGHFSEPATRGHRPKHDRPLI